MSLYAERTCDKKRHKSQRAAKVHIALLIDAGHVKKGEMQVYLCKECKWFHVGHPPQDYLKRTKTNRKRERIQSDSEI